MTEPNQEHLLDRLVAAHHDVADDMPAHKMTDLFGCIRNPAMAASSANPRLCLLNQTCEKRCNVAGESHWFFCGCEMPTALHWCPPLDVI